VALVHIAVETCEAKIFNIITTIMLDWYDVVNVKWRCA
jgi:hypothetical protein